ncbi:MAG: class I SAM-dependent methyltransferase [Pseudomonadota bacterium]
MASKVLQRYLEDFSDVDGFFMPLAMATWDFLFGTQDKLGITGGMLEIGVFKGKSAVLSALYMKPEEPAFFIDLHEVSDARERVLSVKPDNATFFAMNSANALSEPQLLAHAGKLRWVHIDGEHTGYATRADLETAAHLLSRRGIICVDDFLSFKYPQLTASVYDFLFSHPMEFKMFLASANKCYICRAAAAHVYDEQIRLRAIEDMALADNLWTLTRTSFMHDYGCFSIIPRNKNRDFVGLDRDMDAWVF